MLLLIRHSYLGSSPLAIAGLGFTGALAAAAAVVFSVCAWVFGACAAPVFARAFVLDLADAWVC
jgi:hypothetical protein